MAVSRSPSGVRRKLILSSRSLTTRSTALWSLKIRIRIFRLHKAVERVVNDREERISFLRTPDGERDTAIVTNHSQRLPHFPNGIDKKHRREPADGQIKGLIGERQIVGRTLPE